MISHSLIFQPLIINSKIYDRHVGIQVGQGLGCIVIIFCMNSHLRDSSPTLIELSVKMILFLLL